MSDTLETIRALGREMMEMRERCTKLDRELEEVKARRDEVTRDLWDTIQEAGVPGIPIDLGEPYGVMRFQPGSTPWGNIYDEQAFLEWVEENGYTEQMTKPKFAKRQINEYVKTLLDTSGEFPPGLDHKATKYITATKIKPKVR